MTCKTYTLAELAPHPWKNGGGLTRELAAWPPGAGLADFGWRASVAEVASSGPFSAFPGVDRTIVLLDGGGMRLATPDGAIAHDLSTPLAPFAFAGEAPIASTLLGGPSHDFNVMTRRAAWRADVQVLYQPQALAAASHGLLHAARGTWLASHGGAPAEALDAGGGLLWHDAAHAWHLIPETPDAALIVVLLHPVHVHD